MLVSAVLLLEMQACAIFSGEKISVLMMRFFRCFWLLSPFCDLFQGYFFTTSGLIIYA